MTLITATKAAKLLGISKQAVNQDQLTDQFSNNKTGAARRIDDDYITAKFKALRESKSSEDMTAARTRKEIALANMAEDEAAFKRGELVSCGAIESGLCTAFGNFRNALMALPNRVSPMVVGIDDTAEVRKILNEHFETVLNDLHDELDKVGDG